MNGMPMISNDLRSSCRALLLQSYDKGGEGKEIEVEWKYPDDWLPLPKADARQCILLIRPSEERKKIGIVLYTYFDVINYPNYFIDIDWGDGDVITLDNTQITVGYTICEHEYFGDFIGSYLLIKIQTTFAYTPQGNIIETGICGFNSLSSSYIVNVLAASVGNRMPVVQKTRALNAVYVRFEMTDINEMSVDSTYRDQVPYTGYYRSIFDVFVANLTKRIDYTGSPEIFGSDYYSNGTLSSLRTIQGTDNIKKISDTVRNIFNYTYSLERFIFPRLEEIPDYFLQYTYGLRIVYAPKCNKIGSGTLSGNYSLQTVTIAEDCEISENALQDNYQYVEVIEGE